ncbi:hypothetical protein SAMN02800694_1948 [Luteibacter sp. UNCMF331Sha3.1]|jgi:hypothetical protein|uniref:hypothetical protein n=1 Tax=Luteibacter sp. UNCMF331Sha3.1 TaxID=1502760 RepID=UPI0008CC0EEF|nr:hypothetical protein [Luteibacter sp. UNCMF331Sha3.1]SEM86703.1 hypothetical protein SAMN02800694_1948 [Luteibacter sp. UNCMF331Sha3.1]
MNRALSTTALAAILFMLAPAAPAGVVAFRGAIVEEGCAVRDQRLACPPGHPIDARLERFDADAARRHLRAPLFAYAVTREPERSWRLIEVTYR